MEVKRPKRLGQPLNKNSRNIQSNGITKDSYEFLFYFPQLFRDRFKKDIFRGTHGRFSLKINRTNSKVLPANGV